MTITNAPPAVETEWRPPTVGRFVDLRPVRPVDLERLYDFLAEPSTARSWRFRGESLDPQRFFADISAGVVCQFIVSPAGSHEIAGFVQLFNADPMSGCAHVSVAIGPASRGASVAATASLAMLLDHAFATYPLRKVYIESSQDVVVSSLGRIVATGGPVVLEGVLRGNVWFDGAHRDTHIYAVWPDAWRDAELAARLRGASTRRGPRADAPSFAAFAASFGHFVESIGHPPAGELYGGTLLADDLGLDSLAFAELLVWAEDEFGCVVEGDPVCHSLQDVYDALW